MDGPSCVEIRGADAPVRPGCRPQGGHENKTAWDWEPSGGSRPAAALDAPGVAVSRGDTGAQAT